MKKILFKSLTCLAAVALMTSCYDTMDDKADIDKQHVATFTMPEFAFASAPEFTYNTASFVISLSDTTYVYEEGVQISDNAEFSTENDGSVAYLPADEVAKIAVVDAEGFEPETKYYVRPYIFTVNGQTVFGQTTSFTTEAAPAETWVPKFLGTYTYVNMWEGDDEGLTLCNLEQDPSKWKIEHWGGDVDFIFTLNDDGTIAFDPFYVGAEYGSYGAVAAYDMAALYPDDFDVSYYDGDKGAFVFSIGYRVEADWIGYDPETFTLTALASAKGRQGIHAVQKSQKEMKNNLFPFSTLK